MGSMQILTFFITVIITIFISTVGLAESACMQNSRDAKSLSVASKDICNNLCKPLGSMTGKNAPNYKEEIKSTVFGLLSASSKMESLLETATNALKNFEETPSGCPDGCKRQNNPALIISISPTKVTPIQECPTKYSPVQLNKTDLQMAESGVTFENSQITKRISFTEKDKSCQTSAADWAQSILRGKNQLGKMIESEKCPSPCSYASSMIVTEESKRQEGCSVIAKLQINCGPPRDSSEWVAQAHIYKNWKCEPAKTL